MRINTLILIFAFFSSLALATAQRPDKLKWNDELISLQSNPLETYFNKFPDKKSDDWSISTGLWRGYIAEFAIEDNLLIVTDIKVRLKGQQDHTIWTSVIDQVMKTKEERIVSWYDGLLIAPQGKLLTYVHMGYASQYAKYTVFRINAGKVIHQKNFSLDEYQTYKKKQFDKYRLTETYKNKREKYLKYAAERSENFDVDAFMFIYDDFAQHIYVDFE